MPTLIATKGDAAANAYADANDADDFLDNIYGVEEWSQLVDDDKERLLITATKMIDRLTVTYDKADAAQALKFPITDPSDGTNDGWDAVQEATILQATYLLANNDAIQEAQNIGIQGVRSESLSSVSKSTTGFNPMRRWHPDVLKLLAGYIDLEFKLYRG
jgi:hypothetical protein